IAEVVDVDFAVNLWCVKLGAAFPEQRGLFAFAFGQQDHLAADPLLLGALADGLLELHQAALAGLDGALVELAFEREGGGAFFVGVAEYAQPVESCLLDELLQEFKVAERFSREADDETGAEGDAGNGGANLLQCLQENIRTRPALHRLEYSGRCVLKRDVEVFADVFVAGDGVEELAGDAVGVGVEEAEPAESVDAGECVEERGEAVLDAKIFAVACGVLADESDFLNA